MGRNYEESQTRFSNTGTRLSIPSTQIHSKSRMIKTVTIELGVRPNKIDPFAETLFAAREVVKLGLAKYAEAMPWGIRAVGVPANRLQELQSHAKSMGASRWWIVN
jgi:hypothetical protein